MTKPFTVNPAVDVARSETHVAAVEIEEARAHACLSAAAFRRAASQEIALVPALDVLRRDLNAD